MFSRRIFAVVAISAFVIAGFSLNHYKDDIPSNIKIGARSFGDTKVIKIGDNYIGDNITIREFEEIRSRYKEMKLSSKEALQDFTKLILLDRVVNKINPDLRFEDTVFFGENSEELMDRESELVKNLEQAFGLEYDEIKNVIVISEKRGAFDRSALDISMNSDSLKPLYDSVTRNLFVDDYVIDFEKIEGHNATEDEYLDFYESNKIKEDDTLEVDSYVIKGIQSREDVDKFSLGDMESARSRAMDFESEKSSSVLKVNEMSKILGIPMTYDGGEFFIDDNKFDEDGIITLYLVNKVNKGKEFSVDEARYIIKPALTKSKKIEFINNILIEKVVNGEDISKEDYLSKVGSNIEYNIINEYDNPLFEVLISLSKGDFYSYNGDDEVHILNIVDVKKLNGLNDEHTDIIRQYYATKLKNELLKFQELIMFNGMSSKSYNFEEF